jgi:hypothetical protein
LASRVRVYDFADLPLQEGHLPECYRDKLYAYSIDSHSLRRLRSAESAEVVRQAALGLQAIREQGMGDRGLTGKPSFAHVRGVVAKLAAH